MLSKFKRVFPRVSALIKQPKASFAVIGRLNNLVQSIPLEAEIGNGPQFDRVKLADSGDLPIGDIPEALKYDRPVGKLS